MSVWGVEPGLLAGCGCPLCAAEAPNGAAAPEAAEWVWPASTSGAGLVSGLRWSTTTVTFSFPSLAAAYDADPSPGVQYGLGEAVSGFQPLDAAQQAAARAAFAGAAAVSGLRFVEAAPEAAAIRLAQSAVPATAWAYLPGEGAGGDAWLGTAGGYFAQPEKGGYGFHAILHEIGHALGLKHGHEVGASGPLPADEDSMEHSVMTYRAYAGATLGGGYPVETFGYAQSYMQADIAALQQLYGANYAHNAGDTTYAWSPDTGETFIDGVGQGAPAINRIFLTIWDGGGTDTFDFSAYDTDLRIDLRPGAASLADEGQLSWLNRFEASAPVFASGNVYTARLFEDDPRALIENAAGGAGHDRIIGNLAANAISGGAGRDRLEGLEGDDSLDGGDDADRLEGGAGADRLRGGEGNDALFGGDGHDRLIGASGDDELEGGSGADSLGGGGGNDRLLGGTGRDRLLGGGGSDALSGGGGADLLRGGGGGDALDGAAGGDRLSAGAGADRLIGGAGRDSLFGGAGADTLSGGAGPDLLNGGAGADRFLFAPGGGADAIADFGRGADRIDLSAFAIGLEDLRLVDTGAGALVLADGLRLTLLDFAADDLADWRFLF